MSVEASKLAPLKVLIADDHPLMLAGIRRALERSEDIEVVGEARSGRDVIDLVERRRPQLVLMDLSMPGNTGSECIEQVRSRWPDVRVVVLSARADRASIDGALSAGASAYVIKSVVPTDLASVLRHTASDSVYHATSGPQPPIIGQLPFNNDGPEPLLTSRERMILTAVAAGKTTATIGEELWVSQHTVKFHLTNIYRKLGVPNRAGAVRYALEHGVIAA